MKNISTTLFDVTTVKGSVRQGALLVAEPFLSESYFNHSVLAVVDYSLREGAMGVVLNQPTRGMLSDVLPDVSKRYDAPLFCGGPMGHDRLFFIHTLGPDIIPGSRSFAPGLYIGGDVDTVVAYVNSGYEQQGCLRFFVGYSGWGPGQLEQELDADAWAIGQCPLDPSTLLRGAGDAYWHSAVRRLGGAYRSWRLFPRNPVNN